jgi:hypothetical protein
MVCCGLIQLGVPSRTAYRRCAPGGPWQRLLPGVLLLGNLPPTSRQLPKPVVRDGVPLAPLTRSVLDACRRFTSHAPARALITQAVQRYRPAPGDLVHELEVGSQRGTAVPRAVLKDIVGGARSVAEVDAMRVWERTGLPSPVWNVALRNGRGEHIAVPDAWFDVGLAWETLNAAKATLATLVVSRGPPLGR